MDEILGFCVYGVDTPGFMVYTNGMETSHTGRNPMKRLDSIDIAQAPIHGERYSNLGPGYHLDLPGATQLTIHRGKWDEPRISWINEYGNVRHNNGEYGFTVGGAQAAGMILDRIETEKGNR